MPDATSPEQFRLFIAIPLPALVQDEIEKTQTELRRAMPGDFIRWTKREQFHLTLKFLGNVEARQVGPLEVSLQNACRHFSPVQLRAKRIGFFPDERHPRVIWVSVHDDKEFLPKVQTAIESAVARFTAEKPEGKFTGHVTLGRCKTIKRPQAEQLAKLASGLKDKVFGEWTVDHVELIRSELSSGGSRYSVLATAPFTK